jgi:hypothetical protein
LAWIDTSVSGKGVEEPADGLVVGQVRDLLDPDLGQRLLDLGPALLLADQVGGAGDGLVQQFLGGALGPLRLRGGLRGLLRGLLWSRCVASRFCASSICT